MAATDHDTTASVDDVRALAAERGIEAIAGIEITAVEDGRDIHVLGYFLNPSRPGAHGVSGRRSGGPASIACGRSPPDWLIWACLSI